jgi:hypothetical protein
MAEVQPREIVGYLIVAVLLGALLPTIANSTIGIAGTGNITGATAVVVALVPLFIVIIIILKLAGKI